MSATNPGIVEVTTIHGGSKCTREVALGALSLQEPSAVSITGGAITGLTNLAPKDATASTTIRQNLGLEIGVNVQAYDAETSALAGLTAAANGIPYFTGTTPTTAGVIASSANMVSLLQSADYATARTNLGLAIGSNVQGYDAGLASIAGLTTSADKSIYTTGSDTYATMDVSTFARTILDDTSAAAVRTTIGVGPVVSLVQNISSATAIEVTTNHAKITGPAEGTYAVTLAAPSSGGQTLVIEMVATTAVCAVTLDLTNVVGGTAGSSASFDAADETLVLVSRSNKWIVLKEMGVTLS